MLYIKKFKLFEKLSEEKYTQVKDILIELTDDFPELKFNLVSEFYMLKFESERIYGRLKSKRIYKKIKEEYFPTVKARLELIGFKSECIITRWNNEQKDEFHIIYLNLKRKHS
jgi:predicted choloylglycine hydrolase